AQRRGPRPLAAPRRALPRGVRPGTGLPVPPARGPDHPLAEAVALRRGRAPARPGPGPLPRVAAAQAPGGARLPAGGVRLGRGQLRPRRLAPGPGGGAGPAAGGQGAPGLARARPRVSVPLAPTGIVHVPEDVEPALRVLG